MSRAREFYEARMVEILSHVWRKNGDFLEVEPADMETPLTALLDAEAGSTRVDPEWLPSDLQEIKDMDREELMAMVLELVTERDGFRLAALKTLMSFFFSRGPEPLLVAELVFMVAEVMHEEHAWRMNGTQMAALFGRSKQDWQSLREKLIEDLVRRWTRDDAVMGGGKSYSARQRYKVDKKGNTSRKLGRRKGDERRGADDEDDGFKVTPEARRRAERMRLEAERRDLAKQVGCRPEDLDMSKISPKN
jgi:hypothetical protein